ncbi:MAG: hypothetical protein ACLTQG_30635 [Hungatella sp.]|uniref:hypothetical protein n=1 Tax=Hungatella sp. TaxID=2613924 RepID=UPI003992B9E8
MLAEFCLLYALYPSFSRLSIIANGVRNALQSAVISVATTNYDEAYNGLREGYSGGYWLSGEQWEENLDYGDIYEQLDELLGRQTMGDTMSEKGKKTVMSTGYPVCL